MARRQGSETRESILEAAVALFRERGYTGASVRDIAAAAGADPALVIRHFGTKEALFLAVAEQQLSGPRVLDGPIDTLGERLVEFVLAADTNARSIFLALVRASDTAGVHSRLRRAHEDAFVGPLLARLSGDGARLRAHLAAAHLGGLLYGLWIVGDQALLDAPPGELVRRYGSALQTLITPPDSVRSSAAEL